MIFVRDGKVDKMRKAQWCVMKLSNVIWEDEHPNPIIGTEFIVNNTFCILQITEF